MKRKRYSLWMYYALSVTLVLVTLLSVVWYATDRFHAFFIQYQKDGLKSRAVTVSQSIGITPSINENSCLVLKKSDPDIRVTIIDKQGIVLCDSKAEISRMENHAKRLEISQALTGTASSDIRFSNTLKTPMLYMAIPYVESQQVNMVIRTAISLRSIDKLLQGLHLQLFILLLTLLTVIFFVITNIYRKINQPISEITQIASQYSGGRFNEIIPDYDIREIDELGDALNSMVEQVGQLESLRQDFVANVSHELKTPIATIKSYIETVLDGTQHDPENIEYFLNVIRKQNDRLAAIVDDLLMLSRLESAPASQLLELTEHDTCDLFQSCVEVCLVRAEVRNISININCTPGLQIKIDYSLMTQAIVNLLDNAIKYSEDNTTITLSSKSENGQITLSVCDQGSGIPKEDIPRLFERFYRVDKSRSRRIGGTGLGLAIVKHIINIHQGKIEVQNNQNAGCCFIIHFT